MSDDMIHINKITEHEDGSATSKLTIPYCSTTTL